MKKSSGYGSALSLARAISVSARAGDSGSLGCGSGQPYSQRALGQFGLQPVVGGSYVAAAHIFATAQQALRRRRVFQRLRQPEGAVYGVGEALPAPGAALCSMIFVTSPPAWFIVSATACRPPALQQRDQFLPVNHAAAVGGFKTARCARRGGQSAARRSPPGWRRCRRGFTTGARAAARRRLTLAETKKSKGEQYGVGNSIVT